MFGVILLDAAPAHAAADLAVTQEFACSETDAGHGGGGWYVMSNVQATGTLTAIAVSPAGIVDSMNPVGTSLNYTGSFRASFTVHPGSPSSATITATVHWDDVNGAPLDRTVTNTISINNCQAHPRATLTSQCNTGALRVTMSNGTSPADAGGQPEFTITGDGGFVQSNIYVSALASAYWEVPAANAGHVVVTSGGATIAGGGYEAAPGCHGYTAPATTAARSGRGVTNGSGTGGSGSGGATGTSGTAASAVADSASARASTDPSPSESVSGQLAAGPSASLRLTTSGTTTGSGPGPVVYLALTIVLLGLGAASGGVWWLRRKRVQPTPTTEGTGNGGLSA
jgi:hypothetical protein